jgi:hypothetical protein
MAALLSKQLLDGLNPPKHRCFYPAIAVLKKIHQIFSPEPLRPDHATYQSANRALFGKYIQKLKYIWVQPP